MRLERHERCYYLYGLYDYDPFHMRHYAFTNLIIYHPYFIILDIIKRCLISLVSISVVSGGENQEDVIVVNLNHVHFNNVNRRDYLIMVLVFRDYVITMDDHLVINS